MRTVEDKLGIAIQALEDIVNPLGKMERELPEGHTLNSQAWPIAESVAHARSLAKDVLQEIGQ